MKLTEVIKEAERFIKLAKVKGESIQRQRYTVPGMPGSMATVIEYKPMDNAAIKRASLDLTRALAALRKTYVGQWRD